MKEDLMKIYGNELAWLKQLGTSQKMKVAYFAMSMTMAMGMVDANWCGLLLIAANVAVSGLLVMMQRYNK